MSKQICGEELGRGVKDDVRRKSVEEIGLDRPITRCVQTKTLWQQDNPDPNSKYDLEEQSEHVSGLFPAHVLCNLKAHGLLSVGDAVSKVYSTRNQVGLILNNVSDLTNVVSI